MSFHKPTGLELAVHEAGHAYAFAAAVAPEHPVEMVITADDAGHARGWSKRRTLFKFGTSRVRPSPLRGWQAAAEIFIAVSGPLAEFRHRHRNRDVAAFVMQDNVDRFLMPDAFDTDGDFERIRSIMDYVAPIDRRMTLRSSIDVADVSMASNWPSVTRLARRLIERGRMDNDELSTWFADHPAKPCAAEFQLIS